MKPLPGTRIQSCQFPQFPRGFTAEPRSISPRPHQIPRPSNLPGAPRRAQGKRDDGVCSFAKIRAASAHGGGSMTAGCAVDRQGSSRLRPGTILRSRRGRSFVHGGARHDLDLFEQAPAVVPRPESAAPYRISPLPAGGQCPAGASFAPASMGGREGEGTMGVSVSRPGRLDLGCPAAPSLPHSLPPSLTHPAVTEGGRRRNLPPPSDLSRRLISSKCRPPTRPACFLQNLRLSCPPPRASS
jgi:hypothetical protein